MFTQQARAHRIGVRAVDRAISKRSIWRWILPAPIVVLSLLRGYTMAVQPERHYVAPVEQSSPHCGDYVRAFKLAGLERQALESDERMFHYSMPYRGSQRETFDIAARAVQSNGCIHG